MKKLLTIIILSFLISCSLNSNTTTKVDDKIIQEQKKINTLIKKSPEDQRSIFSELNKANLSWDIDKKQELLDEIKKMEESKKLELDEAVKKWDNEKAKSIRKEMLIFNEFNYQK